MKIELNKNELAGALSALGKLVSRTSPVEAFRSVEIKGQNNALTFWTSSADETIQFQVQTNETEEFATLILFDHFRNAVRGCRTKSLTLEWNGTFLVLDDTVMPGINDSLPAIPEVPAHAQTAELSENFAELLGLAAPVVNRNDYRKVLQGINLSESGITATNGKELYHFPLAVNQESTTIPFPLAFMATHVHATGTLSMWGDECAQRFRITAGNWTWAGKAMTGTYPNWRLVVPKPEDLTRSVTFRIDGNRPALGTQTPVPEALSPYAWIRSCSDHAELHCKKARTEVMHLYVPQSSRRLKECKPSLRFFLQRI